MQKIKSWQDIWNYENYKADVNPKSVGVAEFLFHYDFNPQLQPCGIAGCHQPHGNGHLIRLLDGTVTNVGHCCGKKLKNYDEKLEVWKRTKRRSEMLQRIGNERERVIKESRQISDLIKMSTALTSNIRSFGERFPNIRAALYRRFSKHDLVVRMAVRRSEAELEEAKAMEPWRKREELEYKTTVLGQLIGLTVFNAPVGAQLADLSRFAVELESCQNLGAVRYERLSAIELSVDSFGGDLAAARAKIVDGEKFFCEHNYDLIRQDVDLPIKERRLLEARGCDAFIAASFGGDIPATKNHKDIAAMKRAMHNLWGGDEAA